MNIPNLPLLLGLVIVLLVACAGLMLTAESRQRDVARRIAALNGTPVARQRRGSAAAGLLQVLHDIGQAMRKYALSDKDIADLQRSLAASGFKPSRGLPVFVGVKMVCLIVIPLLGWGFAVLRDWAATQQALAVAAALPFGMLLPNWGIGLLRRPYQAALRRGIPDALDLMVVCAEAGLGLESSVERVAQEIRQTNRPVGLEFALFSQELRVMADRRQALANLAARTGQDAFRRLAATLAQTMKYGTPLAQGLRVLAAEMRQERLIRYEERAARLPALLVLPMIIFILPCLFIVLIGPSLIQLAGFFGSQH